MAEITVTLNEIDIKALSLDCYSPSDWVDNCKTALGDKAPNAILNKIKKNKIILTKKAIAGDIVYGDDITMPIGVAVEEFSEATLDAVVDSAIFQTAKEIQDAKDAENTEGQN